MADELNIPTHRWYQKRNHIALAKEDFSRQYIYDSGIQKIDAWINSQPWGIPSRDGVQPSLYLDFTRDVFATRELDAQDYTLDATKTAHEIITSGRSTGQTVIDSDGNLKWVMENLYRNGAGGAQSITVVSGVDYTIRAASGSVVYSGAATGTLDASAGVARVEVTASTTTLTITPTAATEIAVYRSDLAGMQFDKYGSDYLPNTTGAALYSLGVDYETGVGGMQVWEGRTNLIPNFEVTSAKWNSSGAGVLTDQSLSVLGVFAGCLVESGGAATDGAINTGAFGVTSGVEYAASFVWSDSDSDSINIRLFEAAVGISQASVTAAGVFTQGSVAKGPVVLGRHLQILPGLYRTTVIWTPNFTGNALLAGGPNSATPGDGILLYATQFEAGSSGGPWIPTYGTTQTRGADNLSTLLSSFGYNVNEGTVVADFITAGSEFDFGRVYQLGSGAAVDGKISTEIGGDNVLRAYADDGATLSLGSASAAGSITKVAHAFKTDDFAASRDGDAVVVDTSGAMPALNTSIFYGSNNPASKHLNGEIRKIAYYPKRISNATLVEATS